MKFFPFLFCLILFSACQNQADKHIIVKDSTSSKETSSDINNEITKKSTGDSINPPTIEDAETLVARYYSARNSEFKYSYYKGLGLQILNIERIRGTDSFHISANVNGRKWLYPNKDTMTIPFEEKKLLRAFKNGSIWQTDSTVIR